MNQCYTITQLAKNFHSIIQILYVNIHVRDRVRVLVRVCVRVLVRIHALVLSREQENRGSNGRESAVIFNPVTPVPP